MKTISNLLEECKWDDPSQCLSSNLPSNIKQAYKPTWNRYSTCRLVPSSKTNSLPKMRLRYKW